MINTYYILSCSQEVQKFIYFIINNFSIGILLKSYGYLSFQSFTSGLLSFSFLILCTLTMYHYAFLELLIKNQERQVDDHVVFICKLKMCRLLAVNRLMIEDFSSKNICSRGIMSVPGGYISSQGNQAKGMLEVKRLAVEFIS